ncbi:MAG: ferritin-like domain-containing protein, partial [Gemmatimonadetes bacterium]|nr:ferritin-like domain-containing protein [Gemmatimonadota bacterium]
MTDREPGEAALVAELNDLLQLDHDAVQAYTLAISSLPMDAYRESLTRYREDHERHVAELSELIRRYGGVPVQLPHLPTGVFKLAVQAAGAAGEHRAVLLAFKTNEGQARDKYRRHAEALHSPEVDEVIRRAAADEERHYAWVTQMLDRLGAGAGTLTGTVQSAVEQVHGRTADAVEAAERRVMEGVERVRRGVIGG